MSKPKYIGNRINLLRELAIKDKIQELIEAWIEIWNQGYIDNFPRICIESLQKELDVYDFAEYILIFQIQIIYENYIILKNPFITPITLFISSLPIP